MIIMAVFSVVQKYDIMSFAFKSYKTAVNVTLQQSSFERAFTVSKLTYKYTISTHFLYNNGSIFLLFCRFESERFRDGQRNDRQQDVVFISRLERRAACSLDPTGTFKTLPQF